MIRSKINKIHVYTARNSSNENCSNRKHVYRALASEVTFQLASREIELPAADGIN